MSAFNPQNCAGKPAGDSLEKLEATLALCKSRRQAAGHVAPTISCMTENLDALRRGQALDAATARLQAITLQARADVAKAAARTAAAVVVAPRPPAKASSDTSRSARREAARIASTLTPANAHNFSESHLRQTAVHRSSPESDKAIATAELEKRGFTVSPSGVISKSTRK
jgi:hypothetical protein